MTTLLKNLANSFSKYEKAVNEKYQDETNTWDALFRENEDFYRGIFFVINNFLNNTEDKELFIELPMQELGRREKTQKNNLLRLQEIILDILQLATKDQLTKNLSVPQFGNVKLGDCYYDSTGQVWQTKTYADGNVKPYIEGKDYTIVQKQQLFDTQNRPMTKLLRYPCSAQQMKAVFGSGFKLVTYRNLSTNNIKQYSSAQLVGYWNMTRQLVSYPIIDNPVYYSSNHFDINKGHEVLVVIGDKKYLRDLTSIKNELIRGNIAKMIYIGSEIYSGYSQLTYSFSFRELFTYFNGQFPTIVSNVSQFPFPNELSDLKNIVGNMNGGILSSQDQNSIISYCMYPLLGINVSLPSTYKNDMINYVGMNYGVWGDTCFNMWLTRVSSSTPLSNKNTFVSNTNAYIRGGGSYHILDNYKTYKGNIKKISKKTSGNDFIYLDVKGDWKGYIEILKTLLKYGVLGTYYLVQYEQSSCLFKFFSKEIDTYNAAYRQHILGFGYNCARNNVPSPTLLSFFNAAMLEELSTKTKGSDSITYTLEDDCGANIIGNTGDVIIDHYCISLDELFQSQSEDLPADITYYTNPNNFDQLMQWYFDFGSHNAKYYADLWKQKLRAYRDTTCNGNIKDLKRDFPFLRSLSNGYIDPLSSTDFPDMTIKMAETLFSKELINIVEKQEMIGAYKSNRKHGVIGGIMKSELLKHIIDPSSPTPTLNQIIKNSKGQITLEQIENDCIWTSTIQKIIKIKKEQL